MVEAGAAGVAHRSLWLDSPLLAIPSLSLPVQPASSQAFDFLGSALLAEVLAALEEALPGELPLFAEQDACAPGCLAA